MRTNRFTGGMSRADRVELLKTVGSFTLLIVLLSLMGWSTVEIAPAPPPPQLTKIEIYQETLRKLEAQEKRTDLLMREWLKK